MSNRKKLTLKEFSTQVGYSERHLRRWITMGKLITRRNLGGRSFFYESDVEKFRNHDLKGNPENCLDLTEGDLNDRQ